MKKITKVLIANRGEIACRLIAACKSLGIKTVSVYSEADKSAMHVTKADESVLLGAGPAAESYLCSDKIIAAAKDKGAEAIHPGYGFLSERSHFAEAVKKAGLIWIGPDHKVIDLMGNKIAAKKAAEKAKVPTLPWALLEGKWTAKDLNAAAKKIGFPLLLKAAAGGGGRGMRLVEKVEELQEKAEAAAREAESAFGSSELFLEAYCKAGRHIEVQVLGDNSGSVISIGERECSVQRRHQKVIEEAPAPNLSEKTRKSLWKSAVDLAKSVGYESAGTCEFLVDEKENYFFLEMNTRLQVEHPVTEQVWGVDLPALQLKIAQGEKIQNLVPELSPRGHAIEVRIYAEDPSKNFMPSPGKIDYFSIVPAVHLRVDSGYQKGSEVPIFYDAMLAKVISWGMTREAARKNLTENLRKALVCGVAWNGPYLIDILEHPKFVNGNVTTQFLGEEFATWKGATRSELPASETSEANQAPSIDLSKISPWVVFGPDSDGKLQGIKSKSNGRSGSAAHSVHEDADLGSSEGPLVAEYPGKVLKILVATGQTVTKGQVVVVCESMKMEFSYSASFDTKVKSVTVREGQIIAAGTLLIEWDA